MDISATDLKWVLMMRIWHNINTDEVTVKLIPFESYELCVAAKDQLINEFAEDFIVGFSILQIRK